MKLKVVFFAVFGSDELFNLSHNVMETPKINP